MVVFHFRIFCVQHDEQCRGGRTGGRKARDKSTVVQRIRRA